MEEGAPVDSPLPFGISMPSGFECEESCRLLCFVYTGFPAEDLKRVSGPQSLRSGDDSGKVSHLLEVFWNTSGNDRTQDTATNP